VRWFFRSFWSRSVFVLLSAAVVFTIFVLVGLRDLVAELFIGGTAPPDEPDWAGFHSYVVFEANVALGGIAITIGQIFLRLTKKIHFEGVDNESATEKRVDDERYSRQDTLDRNMRDSGWPWH